MQRKLTEIYLAEHLVCCKGTIEVEGIRPLPHAEFYIPAQSTIEYLLTGALNTLAHTDHGYVFAGAVPDLSSSTTDGRRIAVTEHRAPPRP